MSPPYFSFLICKMAVVIDCLGLGTEYVLHKWPYYGGEDIAEQVSWGSNCWLCYLMLV